MLLCDCEVPVFRICWMELGSNTVRVSDAASKWIGFGIWVSSDVYMGLSASCARQLSPWCVLNLSADAWGVGRGRSWGRRFGARLALSAFRDFFARIRVCAWPRLIPVRLRVALATYSLLLIWGLPGLGGHWCAVLPMVARGWVVGIAL